MKKYLSRFLATLLACVTIFAICSIPASAATSSRFGSNQYCEVRVSNTLLNRRGRQYARIKLETYNSSNASGWFWRTDGKVVVTMRDERGRYIWSGIKKGGDTLDLGDDHTIYRIYVTVYEKPVNGLFGWVTAGENFKNRGKCVSWRITTVRDCTIR